MNFQISADKVVALSRCDQFSEAAIRKMFADHNANEVDLITWSGLEIPLPVKVFIALQDEFFTEEEFRELAIEYAQRAANQHPEVAANHFVTGALAALHSQVSIRRSAGAMALMANHADSMVTGYRAAVLAMVPPGTPSAAALPVNAAYEAVWCATFHHAAISCRNAASCAVAAVPKPQADAELQWILDTAVAKAKARGA